MKKLFDPDSPILRFLTQAAELAWLNILWVVCSLPVFTLGASTAALCTAVRNMIRESKAFQLDSVISTSGALGMITMDQSILKLWQERRITAETAVDYADNPEQMRRRMK